MYIMIHTLPALSYGFDALEPYIDARTMEIHYTKHHQTYIDKLNTGISGTPYELRSAEELLTHINKLPVELHWIIKNHAGGHANHSLFWTTMIPWGSAMSEHQIHTINQTRWSVASMKEELFQKAGSQFGSGRWRLVRKADNTLAIYSLPNQENPLMYGDTPLLWVDVREHAYYLNYQNRRADYLTARWEVVDWSKIVI